jgi:hypothetical protein
MSIFWATPWAMANEAGNTNKQQKELDTARTEIWGGICPDRSAALRINFMGEDIRVWSEECTEISADHMKDYIGITYPGEGTHELVDAPTVASDVLNEALKNDLKILADQAMLDGCDPIAARMTALGFDVIDMIEIPPLGWYRPLPEILDMYCHPWEATEDGPRVEKPVVKPAIEEEQDWLYQ